MARVKDFGEIQKELMKGFMGRKGIKSKQETERDSRRNFTPTQQKELRENQNKECNICRVKLTDDNVDYDHIIPWGDRGKTIIANGQALCLECHRKKTRKEKLKKIDKKRAKKKPRSIWETPRTKLPRAPFG